MEKIHSDHLIKQIGFIALPMEGLFLDEDKLDHYETMLFKRGTQKIVGYIPGDYCRVIIDTRELEFIPFDYMYSFADKMHLDVRNAIWANKRQRIIEAQRLREEREELISRPGNRVHVPQSYGQAGDANGTVLSRQFGEATVRLDYNVIVNVPISQLLEPKKNPKIFVLKGELQCLCGRLEATYDKPFGVDTRVSNRTMIQSRIDSTIKQLQELKAQSV